MMHPDDFGEPPGPWRRSRFGPGATVREGPPSEDSHLLSLFAAANPPRERRKSPRSPVAEHRAWIGWWSGPRRFATVAVVLRDISQGGARLVTADPPPDGEVVWLCLGRPAPVECVRAKVLEVTHDPASVDHRVVRLAFGTPCPQNLYRAAILGLDTIQDQDQDGGHGR